MVAVEDGAPSRRPAGGGQSHCRAFQRHGRRLRGASPGGRASRRRRPVASRRGRFPRSTTAAARPKGRDHHQLRRHGRRIDRPARSNPAWRCRPWRYRPRRPSEASCRPRGSAINPIDVTTDWPRFAAMYGASIDALMTSDEVDAVVPSCCSVRRSCRKSPTPSSQQTSGRDGRVGPNRSMCAGLRRGRPTPTATSCWRRGYRAILGRRRRPRSLPPPRRAARLGRSPRCRRRALFPFPSLIDDAGGSRQPQAFSFLQQAGFHGGALALVTDAEEAAVVAEKMQFPVVLKAERSGLVTRATPAPCVWVSLMATPWPRRSTISFAELARAHSRSNSRRDRASNWSWGLVVIHFRAGRDDRPRRRVDRSLNDVALRVAPIDVYEARTMLDELKGRKLFAGFEAVPPIDRPQLAHSSPTYRNGSAPRLGWTNWTSIRLSPTAVLSPS